MTVWNELHQRNINLSAHDFLKFLDKLVETDRIEVDPNAKQKKTWYRLRTSRTQVRRLYNADETD